MTTLRETLAGTASRKGHLGVRLRHFRDAGGWGIFCECGERISDANEDGDGMILSQIEDEQYTLWHAHLESVVLAWVGARLGEESTLRDAALEIDTELVFCTDIRTGSPNGRRAAGAAIGAVGDALGVPVAPNSAPVDVDPTSTLAAEFDRSNDTGEIRCPACPFAGCEGCEAEAANRAMLEAE